MPLRYSLRELEVFAAIARQGSVSRAADAVALTQSAASQALARLERALGQPLFDRCGRRLVLSEYGRLLWPRAQALLDAAGQLQDVVAGQAVSLQLGASTTIAGYVLPPLLAALRAAHPQARVRLLAGNTAEVVTAVAGLELDFGLIEGDCRHPDLHVSDWREDELVLIAPPGHPATHARASRRQLAAAPWLLREPGSGTREAVERWLRAHVGAVRVDMELGNSEAIRGAVAAGLGLSCLSRHVVAEALAAGSVARVRTGLPALSRPLRLVRHRERAPTPGMQAFLALDAQD
ncbi:MAG: LysR family transcriptional regulator [Burkholderiaceae bacterium]|jgi:DNA-binding transcriptional LysR family regulator|nr:LysR family transcriptional regulator [Burkholderiaceae bacterium]